MTGQNHPTKRTARKAGLIGLVAISAAPANPASVGEGNVDPPAEPVQHISRPDDKTSALQPFTNIFSADGGQLPCPAPVRRRYSPQERLQVAETRRQGACAQHRASRTKCCHNTIVDATSHYDYKMDRQSHELFALGYTTPCTLENETVHKQAAKQTIEAVDDKLVTSPETVEDGAVRIVNGKAAKPPSASNASSMMKLGALKRAAVPRHPKYPMQGQLKPFRINVPRSWRPAVQQSKKRRSKKEIGRKTSMTNPLRASHAAMQPTSTVFSEIDFSQRIIDPSEWKPEDGASAHDGSEGSFGQQPQVMQLISVTNFKGIVSNHSRSWRFHRRPSGSSDQDSLQTRVENDMMFPDSSPSPQRPGTPGNPLGLDSFSIDKSFVTCAKDMTIQEQDSDDKAFSFQDYLNVWDDETAVSDNTQDICHSESDGQGCLARVTQ